MSDQDFNDYAAWRLRRIKNHMVRAETYLDDADFRKAFASFRDAHDEVSFIRDEGDFDALFDAIHGGAGAVEEMLNDEPTAERRLAALAHSDVAQMLAEAHLSLRERQPETEA